MLATRERTELRIDLGCGAKKTTGYVGVDMVPAAGVDHVVDLMSGRLPFEDDSVDEVFSSHFLEHVAEPNRILLEILRVCRDGAKVHIWTPYTRHVAAFLGGHVSYHSELSWEHVCNLYPEMHLGDFPGVLRLDAFHYVLSRDAERWLNGIPLPVAIRYMFNVVFEMKAELTVLKGEQYREKSAYKAAVTPPLCFYGGNRDQRKPVVGFPNFWKFDP